MHSFILLFLLSSSLCLWCAKFSDVAVFFVQMLLVLAMSHFGLVMKFGCVIFCIFLDSLGRGSILLVKFLWNCVLWGCFKLGTNKVKPYIIRNIRNIRNNNWNNQT